MNSNKPVTLKTIADILGIKPATVSKALRDESDVSEATKERVKKTAARMGYRPNLIARSLRQQRTFAIGAIVPEITTSFHSLVIRGFYQKARERGYEVFLMISDENAANERRSLEYLASFPVDGIAISLSQETTDVTFLKRLHDQGMPIVFYDRAWEGLNLSSVTIDDRKAAFEMVEYLIQTGRRRIAYLGPTEIPIIAKRRYKGYKEALQYVDSGNYQELIVPCKIDDKAGYHALKEVLEQNIEIDAVFCFNDLVALGAGRAILEKNLTIPEEVALAGFGYNV